MMTTMAVPTIQEEAGLVKGYLRISEAAERLGVHPRTLTRWVHNGKFPGTIKNDPDAVTGSYFRIPTKAIEAFEKRRLVTPQPPPPDPAPPDGGNRNATDDTGA